MSINPANRIILTANKKKEAHHVFEYRELADDIIEAHFDMNAAKADLNKLKNGGAPKYIDVKDGLLGVMCDLRLDLAKSGTQVNHFKVHGTDREVNVIFRETYGAIKPSHETQLREAIGEHFDDLFERTVKIKAIAGCELTDIMQAASQGFEALSRILSFEEYFTPKADFSDRRQLLRNSMSETQNWHVDDAIRQIQYAPQVRIAK